MKERRIPRCGRLIEYQPPHSPFQKLIDSQRKKHGLTGRELADRIGVSQATLWIWLHNVNGYPHQKSYKPKHLKNLSKVLNIPLNKLTSALDASRHRFTPTEYPTPDEVFDELARLIEILEKRET
jgi:transcriptional regulator with XRE-family HTH domain